MRLTLDFLRNTELNIHIVGAAAVEGSVIARFLHSLGAKCVTLHDFCEKKEFAKRFLSFHNGVENRLELWQQMRNLPYPIHFQDTYLEDIESADLIFLNQAWYRYDCNLPRLANLVAAEKIAVSSMTDLYLQLFPGLTIGITGTHGKTTVTRLMGHAFKTAKRSVFTSGNDRHSEQILDQITEGKIVDTDILVLETSNRQLKLPLEKSPNIAIITNIYPNHLDEHKGLDEYRTTKMRIAGHQEEKNTLIVGANDTTLIAWASARKGIVIGDTQSNFIKNNFILPPTLAGEHNLVNVAIVYEVMKIVGVSDELFQQALISFPGVEKRQECILKTHKVQVINDSIATTPTATLMAVKTFQSSPLFLIMGGDNKNIPQATWDELITTIQSLPQCQVVVLPGSIREELASAHWLEVASLEDALSHAQAFIAQQKSISTVLISPAGEAFYTMFLTGKSLEKLAKDYFSSSTTLSRG